MVHLFPTKKKQIWVNFGGSRNENADLLCCHLEYFTALRYILWQFGNFLVIWNIITRLDMFYQRKIWQPYFLA
jgi:hypothetical protein